MVQSVCWKQHGLFCKNEQQDKFKKCSANTYGLGHGTPGQIHKDDVEEYLSKTQLQFMRKHFNSGAKELSIQYKRLIGNDFKKVLLEIKPSREYSEDNQSCFLYVKNIDK